MSSMAIDRRSFCLGGLALIGTQTSLARGLSRDVFISHDLARDGTYGCSLFDQHGDVLVRFELPSRGHGGARHPAGRHAVVFSRRPGTYAAILDLANLQVVRMIESSSDRHFYGHGCFSPDGRWLFATENDFDGERGVIGVYDWEKGLEKYHEFYSHGIGPHEVALMPDGRTLAVANGGILTHPSVPRVKLNLTDMAPNLVLMASNSGELLSRHSFGDNNHQLSIRHLSVNAEGTVAIAMQWEGHETDYRPLVGLLKPGDKVRICETDDHLRKAMNNYAGSVAFNASGDQFMVSSPRGNLLTIWDRGGQFVSSHPLEDGCGVAGLSDGGFIATSGLGKIVGLPVTADQHSELSHLPDTKWDNHIL